MKAVWMWLIVSAYCPCSICCGKHANGRTATGRNASLPGVAVNNTTIPLGSRLDIPGYTRTNGTSKAAGAWILADDVGGKIKGNKIDVRFKTHEEAIRWAGKKGYRRLRVRVWRK